MSTTLLVDGHVHFHSCFGVEPFLEAALSNFRTASRRLGEPDAIGCLMLSENSWNHYFRAFSEGLAERETKDWSVRETTEDCSIVLRKDTDAEIVVIAGRQVVTADRLEVLALGTALEFPDGLPFREAVESVVSSGSIPVVPWGFGKWTARRGRTVRALLSSPDADVLYLGDNGGRPAGAPSPALFRLAGARGVPVLPGSDPLPLPAEVGKPGRYGFVLRGSVDLQAPASSIKSILSQRAQPERFGRLEALPTFVLRQTQLRLSRQEPTQAPQAADLQAGRS